METSIKTHASTITHGCAQQNMIGYGKMLINRIDTVKMMTKRHVQELISISEKGRGWIELSARNEMGEK